MYIANSTDPDQRAPTGAQSGYALFELGLINPDQIYNGIKQV